VVTFKQGDTYKQVGHGTAVVHTLLYRDFIDGKPTAPVCSSVEVEICGYTDKLTEDVTIPCLERATQYGFKYVNISVGGSLVASEEERKAMLKAAEAGVTVVISAGNDINSNLDKVCTYPQCFAKLHKNIIAVGSNDGSFTQGSFLKREEAWSYTVTNAGTVARFSGTSFAAPKYINRLLIKECNINRR
jgi:subtilisin family serine protease